MTKTNILLVGFLFASGSLFAIGCGETDPQGGTSSSSSSSGSGSSSSGSSSSGSSSSSSGGMDAVAAYCTAVLANCTGANAQFKDMASCMGSAAAFPAGTSADMSGDTLGCRTYHAGAAKADAAAATLHCPHAGPSGGGACGTTCDGFCDIAAATCKTEWPDKTACVTACKALPSTMKSYSTADTGGNTIECRLYHGSVAASDAASAGTHCPHTAAVTKMGDPCF